MYAPHAEGVQSPWLAVVGIGERGWDALTEDARAAIEAAELVIGGQRHLALLPAMPGQKRIPWPSPLTEGVANIQAQRGRRVCVLASGDPFWFGVGTTLARHINPAEMQVWPQPSAFALAAARLGWALQHVTCLSACGRDLNRVARELSDGARLLILSADGTTPAALAALLTARGFGGSQLAVFEHLDGPDEQRVSARADQWPHAETAALNTIAVDCVSDSFDTALGHVPGRSSNRFHQDGQITRSEVRAVVLSMLAPGSAECLWDIGAGSGAISVEWMLADTANQAIAIEARDARIQHIRDNATHFGVPDLACVQGHAPEALAGLAAPDAIFIGGGLTSPELLATCRNALGTNPRGRLVATSVTVEGDAALAEAVPRYGGDLRRIQASHAEPLGRFLGWSSDRPITIWNLWTEGKPS